MLKKSASFVRNFKFNKKL